MRMRFQVHGEVEEQGWMEGDDISPIRISSTEDEGERIFC